MTTGFPEIRSLAGAIFVFTFVLYPYVYLLARTAFMARTASMVDAARSLGLTPAQTWWRVNLPLARPAIAAGALLALMETIADYGASAYFGLQTFTTSIYRAWFSLGDHLAASQLAAVLLLLVLALIALEHRARGKARFFIPTSSQRLASRVTLTRGKARLATLICMLPVLLGFAVPLFLLVRLLEPAWFTFDWSRYLHWLGNTLSIATASAILAIIAVLALAYAARAVTRGAPAHLVRGAVRIMSLGYAVPGAVVAVGILVPLATFDNRLDGVTRQLFGFSVGLLLTGSVFALLYGYLVRYLPLRINRSSQAWRALHRRWTRAPAAWAPRRSRPLSASTCRC